MQHRVQDRLGDIHEKAAIDLVGRIRGLVIIRVILDAKVDKRDLRRVKRPVVRLRRPILHAAGDRNKSNGAENRGPGVQRGGAPAHPRPRRVGVDR